MASDWTKFTERQARARLSPREYQVLAAVARKTLGYRKPQGDRISASQIEKLTGISRQHVTETLGRLEGRGLLRRTETAPGRAAVLSVVLEPVPVPGHPDPSQPRDTPPVPVPVSKPVPVSGHTRGKGVKDSATDSEKPDLHRRVFDAYIANGGSVLLERERGALARGVSACVKAGLDDSVILVAAAECAKRRDFPGNLKQRALAIEKDGGPCEWEGLGLSSLTKAQLDECGCPRCAEWASAVQTSKPEGITA